MAHCSPPYTCPSSCSAVDGMIMPEVWNASPGGDPVAARQPPGLGALMVALVFAACGIPTDSTGERGLTLSSGESSGVLLSMDVPYASAPQGWARPVLDLYLPADAGEPPLAVVVPDAGADPRERDYAALAGDLASSGVAVAVVHWGVESPELAAFAGRPVGELVDQMAETAGEVACALAVAAAKVGIRDATSSTHPVVVVGHGLGANAAAMATLTTPRPFEACFAAERLLHVSVALLWDGDWLGAKLDDALGGDISGFLPAYSPWPEVDSVRTTTYVEVGVNANRLAGLVVEATPTSVYLTARDPRSGITDDLSAVDAFADGGLDPVDSARAFAVGLRDAGVPSKERELHGAGEPDTFGPQVRSLVVQSVVQLTRP